VDRFQVLNDLISFNKPPALLAKELARSDWDHAGESFVLTASRICSTLEGFLAQKYDAKALEDWANLIECGEAVTFEEQQQDEIDEVINALANSVLQGDITEKSCRDFLDLLNSCGAEKPVKKTHYRAPHTSRWVN